MRDIAIEAAIKAGEIAKKYFELTTLERALKDDRSLVTIADKESEEAIVKCILGKFPDHGIVGEEGAAENPDAEYQWVIDPIDGTSNFINGIPIFGASIALAKGGEVILGVIYNPVTDSMYVAEKGKGATYNGKTIQVSEQEPKDGMVTFGFGAGLGTLRDEMLLAANAHFRSRRVLGSTAIELCFVARGGIEGTIIKALKPWDYAAGALIVTEAGGTVTDHQGNPWKLDSKDLLASNGVAHDVLLALVEGR